MVPIPRFPVDGLNAKDEFALTDDTPDVVSTNGIYLVMSVVSEETVTEPAAPVRVPVILLT